MTTQTTTISRVRELIVDCLDVDPDEVKPGALLIQDLGAESIDFLDLSFRLEKEFGVKLLLSAEFMRDPLNVHEGMFTDKAMAAIGERSPVLHAALEEEHRLVARMGDRFNVQVIVEFMDSGGD